MKDAVLITGSNKGLGRALAMKFAESGHLVILSGRDKEALEETALAIGAETVMVPGDLREPETITNLTKCAEYHEVGVLINNAGMYLNAPFANLQDDDLREILEVNLIAPLILTRRIYPIMQRIGGGTIVNINSLASKSPSAGESLYAASKGGLQAFSEALNQEATKDHIQVINVLLGAMDTAMQAGRTAPEKCISTDEATDVIYGLTTLRLSLRVTEVELRRARY